MEEYPVLYSGSEAPGQERHKLKCILRIAACNRKERTVLEERKHTNALSTEEEVRKY